MAKYTIELYKLLDDESGMKDIIKGTWNSNVILTNDSGNAHAKKLWEDFVSKYELCEIGFETPALFVRCLKNRIREVVNKFDMKFIYLDELLAREIVERGKTNTKVKYGKTVLTVDDPNYQEQNSGTDHTENETKTIGDETPHKGINIDSAFSSEMYASDMQHQKSASDLDYGLNRHIHGKTKDENITEGGTDETEVTTTPVFDSFEKIEKLKNLTLNYDNEFINEFKDLFMMIY